MDKPVILQYDRDQLSLFLSAIMDPMKGCCELRIFHAAFDRGGYVVGAQQYSSTLSGWYDDPAKLAADASRLHGVSGYVTVNPVDAALLARADNKLIKSRHGTKDDNIICLRWIYIDIDAVRPSDISSTNSELQAALARRDLILSENPPLARSSIWGCSGNGAFILSRLPDLPNDDEHRQVIASTLARLAARYSDDAVKVDPTTRNPSRVMALAGTVKAKGSSREDRPWRMVTVDSTTIPPAPLATHAE